jgi:hypothetical protein
MGEKTDKKVMELSFTGGGVMNLVGPGAEILKLRLKLIDKKDSDEFISVNSELLGPFEYIEIVPSEISFMTIKDYDIAMGRNRIMVPTKKLN